MPMLDCHCHLLDLRSSVAAFLAQLADADISRIYCNSVSARQWPDLALMAASHPRVVPFYGIHPWHGGDMADHDLEQLALLLADKNACCGEIGLDRLCKTDFRRQETLFRRQLDLAAATRSFVAIHCVRAWGPLLEILAEYQGEITFMLHGFQGSLEVMERVVAMGGMISFSDRLLAAPQPALQAVFMATPLDRLLLETDFPFLKSRTGEAPALYHQTLVELYTYVGGRRQLSLPELTEIIARNGSICTY